MSYGAVCELHGHGRVSGGFCDAGEGYVRESGGIEITERGTYALREA